MPSLQLVLSVLLAQLGRPDPDALPYLALRRWLEGQTLTSPYAGPSRNPVWAWLIGLLALVMAAVAIQGPRKALGQILDLRGHIRLLATALSRVRRSVRLVVVLLGVTVLSWTYYQLVHYGDEGRIDDLVVFSQNKRLAEQVGEQGVLAALTPLRDLCSLGDELLLLAASTALVFKLTSDRWGSTDDPYLELENPLPRSTMLCWGTTWLYGMYRFAVIVAGPDGLPLGGCLVVEAALMPLMMAFADGVLLSWVLTELRRTGYSDEEAALDLRAVVRLWPAATLACVAVLPGRYLATALWLILPYAPGQAVRKFLAPMLSGWGLIWLQGAALVLLAMAGAAAWSGGGLKGLFRSFWRMMKAEGGRVAAVALLSGLTSGVAVAATYLIVLSLPQRSWLLMTADGYAHFASLAVGLVALAALVDLGAMSLPRASLVEPERNRNRSSSRQIRWLDKTGWPRGLGGEQFVETNAGEKLQESKCPPP